jgi:ribonuclease P protein component
MRMDDAPQRPDFRFPRERRLRGQRAFAAVYANRLRYNVGPLTICARANEQALTRLGLSVSARVGTAVRRNRIKRRLREAFRLAQHQLPGGYDVVVVVRPHEPASLARYREWLAVGLDALNAEHGRRVASHRP